MGPGIDASEVVGRLARFYGPLPHPPEDAFALYVWEVLGTRAVAGRRDSAFQALRRIPALTPDSIKKVPRPKLEAIVRQCGPFSDERVAALETGADVFRRRRDIDGILHGPLRRAWLTARDLPHLGTSGAQRMLLYAGAHPVVPVDAPLMRLAARLGFVREAVNPRRMSREVRRTLAAWLPPDRAARQRGVQYLAHHAQSTCLEVEPHCAVCPLFRHPCEGVRSSR